MAAGIRDESERFEKITISKTIKREIFLLSNGWRRGRFIGNGRV